jgi:hypothetical protein
LDARLLTKYHAERLAEVELSCVRLAFDGLSYERDFRRAFDLLRGVGFPANKIRVYVLLNFDESPEDVLYRLETVFSLGAWPYPSRYIPLGAQVKDKYVHPGWDEWTIQKMLRYWNNVQWFGQLMPYSHYNGESVEEVKGLCR